MEYSSGLTGTIEMKAAHFSPSRILTRPRQDMEGFCATCNSTQEVEAVPDASSPNTVFCLACGEEFVLGSAAGAGGAEDDKYANYKIARVLSVNTIPKSKDLKKVIVDVTGDGDESNGVQIVTNAKYIEPNWLVVVALEGAVVPAGAAVGEDPDAIQIKPTAVGGVKSCGMVCDSPMLRWTGGAKGIVQQLPEFDETGAAQYFVGSAPPESRPRS
jgi:tRNA-binding EMAP/Myf-like protein